MTRRERGPQNRLLAGGLARVAFRPTHDGRFEPSVLLSGTEVYLSAEDVDRPPWLALDPSLLPPFLTAVTYRTPGP